MNSLPIVLVDDDASILRLLQKHLGDAGCTVFACSDGDEALDLVQRKKPVVLLADWNMPGMTGLELCRRIRESGISQEVYIILLTGNSQPEQIVAGLEAGADDYLVKPAHPAVLLARVRVGERGLRLLLQEQEHAKRLEYEIEERKRAEEELRSAHRDAEQLLEAISSLLISVNANGRVTAWNRTAQRVLGIETKDAVGRSFGDLQIEWDRTAIASGLSECRARNRPTRLEEVRFKRTDGMDGFLGITLHPLSTNANKYNGCLLTAADITQKKIFHSQLAQAQKLESIGQLAAGIAHEINTPIQFVGDNTRFLQDTFGDLQSVLSKYKQLLEAGRTGSLTPELVAEVDAAEKEADVEYLMEETPKAIQQSLEGVDRVAKIVRSMKEFSHPGGEEKRPIDLNKAIETTITVARNEWKYVADVATELDPSLPLVPCLAGDFNQVILNMIINSAHAIADTVGDASPEKGTITIRTRQVDSWAHIEISDTGSGIPEEVRAKIFDPFFTTKEVGKGTGQGLAISHSVIVKKHGGSIEVASEMGKGTTFTIRLPIEPGSGDLVGAVTGEAAHSLR